MGVGFFRERRSGWRSSLGSLFDGVVARFEKVSAMID
jgi:hypothetical protein